MEEESVELQAIEAVRYEMKQEAIESAKNLIREIVKQQNIIAQAQVKIDEFKKGLGKIEVQELSI